ncbi:MAG TPA: spore germination protein, partial [Syntrophomonas wolfei]|nr:spore germination protein [Syntrophomonas wolfei]
MFNLQLIKDNLSHNHKSLIDYIKSSVLTVGQITVVQDIDRVIARVLTGHTAILTEGATRALLIDAKGWETRRIE